MAEEKVVAAKGVAVAGGLVFEEAEDFAGERRRDALVGIDNHDPFVTSLWNRPVFEVGGVHILAFDDAAAAEGADDVERAVGGAGIGNEDFVSDRPHRVDAGADVLDFVFAGDEDG